MTAIIVLIFTQFMLCHWELHCLFPMQFQYNLDFDLNVLQCNTVFIFLVVETTTKMVYSLLANYNYNFLLLFFV